MKFLITVVLLLLVIIQPANGQAKRDTAFLLREFIDGSIYHSIYVENDRKSPYYDNIRNYIAIDRNVYDRTFKYLKDSLSGKVNKNSLKSLDRNWYSLHQFKNKYYVYAASEPYVNTWIGITDSTITLNYFDDGVVPAIIKHAKWINASTIHFTLISIHETDKIIKMHIIDAARGIAIFEFPLSPPDKRYQLMVSANRMQKFPVIINYCKEGRVPEWEFDKPGFRKLLKGK